DGSPNAIFLQQNQHTRGQVPFSLDSSRQPERRRKRKTEKRTQLETEKRTCPLFLPVLAKSPVLLSPLGPTAPWPACRCSRSPPIPPLLNDCCSKPSTNTRLASSLLPSFPTTGTFASPDFPRSLQPLIRSQAGVPQHRPLPQDRITHGRRQQPQRPLHGQVAQPLRRAHHREEQRPRLLLHYQPNDRPLTTRCQGSL